MEDKKNHRTRNAREQTPLDSTVNSQKTSGNTRTSSKMKHHQPWSSYRINHRNRLSPEYSPQALADFTGNRHNNSIKGWCKGQTSVSLLVTCWAVWMPGAIFLIIMDIRVKLVFIWMSPTVFFQYYFSNWVVTSDIDARWMPWWHRQSGPRASGRCSFYGLPECFPSGTKGWQMAYADDVRWFWSFLPC